MKHQLLQIWSRGSTLSDLKDGCAYEFKVPGKNAHSEFSKDIIKILVWNDRHKNKPERLVFITKEKFGKQALNKPMPREYIKLLAKTGLTIVTEYVHHNNGK